MKIEKPKKRTTEQETELKKWKEKVIAEFGGSPNPLSKKPENLSLPDDFRKAIETEERRREELENKENRTPEENEELKVLQDFFSLLDDVPQRLPTEQELEETRQQIETLKNPPKGLDLKGIFNWLDSLKNQDESEKEKDKQERKI